MSGPGIYLEKPVKPASYVANVRQMLGMPDENGDTGSDTDKLKKELGSLLDEADPAKLKEMIEMMKKKK